MSRLFDPLGLVNPDIVKAKVFVQQLWKLKLLWDESLPIEYHTAWEKYRQELKEITQINIPRRVTVSDSIQNDLHIFCDASQVAYGACAYLRSRTRKQAITVQLLIAKSRVCPMKATTIPLLELCAALLAAILMTIIRQALKEVISLNKITFWSDTSIVVGLIQSDEPSNSWKTFVANRLEEIRELTTNYLWKHVHGCDNPADHISRGLSVNDLINCSQWWSGPQWLSSPESEWPDVIIREKITENTERRKELTNLQVSLDKTIDFIEVLERFSKLERLYRSTAYLFRGVTRKRERVIGEIISKEIERSSQFWIKIIQNVSFKEEIAELYVRQSLTKHNSKLDSLSPFLDSNGILRVGGRLQNSARCYRWYRLYNIILSFSNLLCYRVIIGEELKFLNYFHNIFFTFVMLIIIIINIIN